MDWYLKVLKKYAEFKGRAHRGEFWMFTLINVIIMVGLNMIGYVVLETTLLSTLYMLATLVPSIAVGVRRMHDTDHPGWWLLIPLVNLYFACIEGTRGPNQYGPDPKAGG